MNVFLVLFNREVCYVNELCVYYVLYLYFSWRFSLHQALPLDIFDKTGIVAYLNLLLRMNEVNRHLRLKDHLLVVSAAWIINLR